MSLGVFRASRGFATSVIVISGALFYMRKDFVAIDSHLWLQTLIIVMATMGAILGAGLGAWLNDIIGRKSSVS